MMPVFVSMFCQYLSGHPDELRACADNFERSKIYRFSLERTAERTPAVRVREGWNAIMAGHATARAADNAATAASETGGKERASMLSRIADRLRTATAHAMTVDSSFEPPTAAQDQERRAADVRAFRALAERRRAVRARETGDALLGEQLREFSERQREQHPWSQGL